MTFDQAAILSTFRTAAQALKGPDPTDHALQIVRGNRARTLLLILHHCGYAPLAPSQVEEIDEFAALAEQRARALGPIATEDHTNTLARVICDEFIDDENGKQDTLRRIYSEVDQYSQAYRRFMATPIAYEGQTYKYQALAALLKDTSSPATRAAICQRQQAAVEASGLPEHAQAILTLRRQLAAAAHHMHFFGYQNPEVPVAFVEQLARLSLDTADHQLGGLLEKHGQTAPPTPGALPQVIQAISIPPAHLRALHLPVHHVLARLAHHLEGHGITITLPAPGQPGAPQEIHVALNHTPIGRIILDCAGPATARYKNATFAVHGTDTEPPCSFVVVNTGNTSGERFQRLERVMSFCHEFGHALQNLLLFQQEGLSVEALNESEREYTSQYLEKLALTPHFYEGLADARAVEQHLHNLKVSLLFKLARRGHAALLDLYNHVLHDAERSSEATRQFTASFRTAGFIDHRLANLQLNHSFATSYAARYFTYLWSDLLACEAWYDQRPLTHVIRSHATSADDLIKRQSTLSATYAVHPPRHLDMLHA
ncbi:M3 family metallopeptidase [Deinococcus arcticus]|uniref:Peptidase M3A/M3B catalytic domain-containing protein n=1 Tax=Deinococcus arcticus TaxID=2136176 RepID=A0A2T3W3X2_9DEIO|nr:M3 family metallopeptidase [Deinococcus arcticus]PTA66539.1 hypothetical protein C8263_17275 [Deinococcus arcticus]